VEQDVSEYYAARNPGQVQVLGVDLWNGTAAQLGNFRAVTGASFPLLLNGATATGGDVELLYGTYDNYIVLNPQRVVRYHAALFWPHGNRYHVDEIRACVDSLVTSNVDVPPAPVGELALRVCPNPARAGTRVSLSLPEAIAHAEVTVLDIAGRAVATLHRGPLAAGRHELPWPAVGERGVAIAPGVYLVRARLDGERRTIRVAVTR